VIHFTQQEEEVRPLSQDLRLRIIDARRNGDGTGEVSRRFGVSRRSVERFWKQQQTTGQCLPQKVGGHRRSRLEGQDAMLMRWIEEKSDLSLVEIQHRCKKQLAIRIGINALWHRLRRIGLSSKKNDARRRARSS
jgi:transposase